MGDVVVVEGVRYARVYPVAHGVCGVCGAPRNRRVHTPLSVVTALRNHFARFGDWPMSSEWKEATPSRPAFSAVFNMFGSWNGAIRAAGGERPNGARPSIWTEGRIIAAMHEWRRVHRRAPTCKQWALRGEGRPTAKTVSAVFGSWNAALEAAGEFPRGSFGKLIGDVRRGAVPSIAAPKCGGCGGELDGTTEGCSACWDRHRRRQRAQVAA